MLVEYCWSNVENCIKVVEMKLNGKFHRITWMSPEGREQLINLLEEDYKNNHEQSVIFQPVYEGWEHFQNN